MSVSNLRVVDPHALAKAEVVDMAKDILARAEAGELVDLCWSGSHPDGSMHSSYTSTQDAPRRLAGVVRLQHRLQLKWDEAG